MERKGFILMETLMMFIILVIVFVYVYRVVDNYAVNQKRRLFYDDIITLYQAYYTKEALLKYSNLNTINISTLIGAKYGMIVGADTSGFLKNAPAPANFNTVAKTLNLHQIFLTNNLPQLKQCARNLNLNANCQNTYMDEELRSFILTIDLGSLPTSGNYLILIYRRDINGNACTSSSSCFSHFTWVAV